MRLRRLCVDFSTGNVDVESFCARFEQVYNFELDRTSLLREEAEPFAALFEQVIWYSPFPEEREKIPNYRGEDEIRLAVERVLRCVRADSAG